MAKSSTVPEGKVLMEESLKLDLCDFKLSRNLVKDDIRTNIWENRLWVWKKEGY